MAKCPACGRKLHLYNWKPNCPGCGVNLNYYKSNEKLLDEAEATEIEHSKFQPKVDRAKAATIGTWAGRIRMATFLIPIAALFIPLFSITVGTNKKSYNAISIYNVFSLLDSGKLFSDISPILIAVLLLAIPAVCCIVFTVMQIAAGTKKGTRKNIVLSSISITLVAASLVSLLLFAKAPLDDYTNIIINKSEFAISDGDQEKVDNCVEDITAITGVKAADKIYLNDFVTRYESFDESVNAYLTEDEIKAIDEAYENANDVLAKTGVTYGDLRDATNTLNSAVYTYSKLQTAINACIDDAVLHDDEVYSDECLVNLKAAIEEAKDYLALSIARLDGLKNDGMYSESSFTNLQTAVETAEADLEILDKTDFTATNLEVLTEDLLVVELLDDDGSGNKTEKELAQETAQKLESDIESLNGNVAGLVNVSVINEELESLKASFENEEDYNNNYNDVVKASVGLGYIVLLALLVVQLINNIRLNKKGIEVTYTPCLIGGLPSEEFFEMQKQGKTKEEIRRVMLVRLAKMQDEVRIAQEEAERKAEEEKINEIKERMAKKGTEVKK